MFRYIQIVCGMIKAYVICGVSRRRFSFVLPIKFSKNVDIGLRKKAQIKLGKHVSINRNSHIAATENAQVNVGGYTGIGDNCVIVARESISIGQNVMIGANVCIYDHDHNFSENQIMRNLGYKTAPIVIEDNVWIGAGVIILKGVRIGTGSIIAAGTVVTKDIPANTIVYNKRNTVFKPRFQQNEEK